MASELVAQLPATVLYSSKLNGTDQSISVSIPNGMKLAGVSLPKVSSSSSQAEQATYHGQFRIPASLTMSTGLTFRFLISDDGFDSSDLGKVIRLGVAVKTLGANETTDDTVGAGTEQTVDITLSATAGGVVIGSLAIANANLDSAAVGSFVAVKIRRIGSATQDTCRNRVVLYAVDVMNT